MKVITRMGLGFGSVTALLLIIALLGLNNISHIQDEAAREIKALIDQSVSSVDAGSKQVNQAGATMAEIVQTVNHVTAIMAEIAAASNDQSTGIEQVNHAIIHVDEFTQQNAAMLEEAAATVE